MVDLSYPPRSLALHIIEVMADPTVRDWDDVAARVGLSSGSEANGAAYRCFEVYGYGALQPNLLALWITERSMAPRLCGATTHRQGTPAEPSSPQQAAPSRAAALSVDPWRPLSDADSAQR